MLETTPVALLNHVFEMKSYFVCLKTNIFLMIEKNVLGKKKVLGSVPKRMCEAVVLQLCF